MQTYRFDRSRELFDRYAKVAPAAPTYGLGHFALGAAHPRAPVFVDHAAGSRFWDVDGNEFVDWMCAYGPMVLGYGHPAVEEAAARQREKASLVSIVSPVMMELAEQLVEMVPVADWAVFAKNGADPTNLSTMVAKCATGRSKVVKVAGGYHGTAQWMQDAGSPGTSPGDQENVLTVAWNDFAGFEQVVSDHGDDVACFISSAYHHPVLVDNEMPAEGYWAKVEALCRQKGILIIVDDVRAGFRTSLGGTHEHFGFKPDLVCFGKALGNGYPISALVGTEALRQAAAYVFYTGTNFFAAVPMAAALATLRELQRIDAPRIMWELGEKLGTGMVEIAKSHGFDLVVSGVPSMFYLRLADETDRPALTRGILAVHEGMHADWIAECVSRGAYFLSFHNHFVSTAHTQADLQRTWDIVDDAFKSLARSYRSG
jgi:glutamate-1-semialdehyde 2,1-aminomutase